MDSQNLELIRNQFQRDRDKLNKALDETLGTTPNQRAIITIFRNAQEAGNPITYQHNKEQNTWIFTIGDQQMTVSDPDIAAAGIGTIQDS